jgi:hypothetical protein
MTRINRTAYRWKRKAVVPEAPAVVATESSRRPVSGKTAAEGAPAPGGEGGSTTKHVARDSTNRCCAPDLRCPRIVRWSCRCPVRRSSVGGDYKQMKAAMAGWLHKRP